MTWFSERSGRASTGTRRTATTPQAHSATNALRTMNRWCSDHVMRRLIMVRSSGEFLAATRHGGAEERIFHVCGAAEPPTRAEDGCHRTFEHMQPRATGHGLGSDEVGQRG